MIVDNRKKNFVALKTLDSGEGFVFENRYYMVINRDSIDISLDFVPALNLSNGEYEELGKNREVERCKYEINVY